MFAVTGELEKRDLGKRDGRDQSETGPHDSRFPAGAMEYGGL